TRSKRDWSSDVCSSDLKQMSEWFYNPEVSFHMWETAHLITIGIAVICIIALFIFQKALIPYRRYIRLTAGWVLFISRLSLDYWRSEERRVGREGGGRGA